MDTLTAIATNHGLDLLKSELKSTAIKYALIGASTHDKPDSETFAFYEAEIETSYYDDNGVLTFIVHLPVDQDFNKYLYAIHILDANDQVVVQTSTPKLALAKGIGGMLTIKAAVTGEAGEVVFKAHDYITQQELEDLWIHPIYANAAAIINNSTRALKQHKRIVDIDQKLESTALTSPLNTIQEYTQVSARSIREEPSTWSFTTTSTTWVEAYSLEFTIIKRAFITASTTGHFRADNGQGSYMALVFNDELLGQIADATYKGHTRSQHGGSKNGTTDWNAVTETITTVLEAGTHKISVLLGNGGIENNGTTYLNGSTINVSIIEGV